MVNRRNENYISVLLLAAFLFFCLFPEPASAEPVSSSGNSLSVSSASGVSADSGKETDPPGDEDPPEVSGIGGESSAESGEAQNKTATVTFDLNGGTGVPKNPDHVPIGTSISEMVRPTRKGYRFLGWISNSGDEVIRKDTVLTAQWEKIAPASSAVSRLTLSSAGNPPIDTHESEIEQAASEAEQAASDPDALSSQDWSTVLSPSSEQESSLMQAGGTVSLPASSVPAVQNGGPSTLLFVGILLLIAGLGGIGAFVYLQFFRGRRGQNAPKGPSGGEGKGDETAGFTDISSYSDGRRGRDSEELHRLMKTGENGSGQPRDSGSDSDWDAFFVGK